VRVIGNNSIPEVIILRKMFSIPEVIILRNIYETRWGKNGNVEELYGPENIKPTIDPSIPCINLC